MGISYYYTFEILWASHVLLVGKNLPANQETYEMQVRFMDWEDPLEEGIAIHSNILAWRVPWTDTVHRVVKSWTWLKRLMHAEIFQVFEGIATLEVK